MFRGNRGLICTGLNVQAPSTCGHEKWPKCLNPRIIKYTKNNYENPLNSSINSNHAQVCYILLSEMLTRFVNPNFRHLWVTTKTCIIFSSYQQDCWSRGLVGTGPQFLVDHYDCDTFGPKRIWSPDIWSPRIGPQLIGPSGEKVPNQFNPCGQMVPKNLIPLDKWSLK